VWKTDSQKEVEIPASGTTLHEVFPTVNIS
jgi:hypothetical protein